MLIINNKIVFNDDHYGSMVFRRCDPGPCLGDWFVTVIHECASDSQKRGFQSDQLGIILGFNKDIWVRLWKSKISMDWIGNPFGINTESWNNKGSLLVSDPLQYWGNIFCRKSRTIGGLKNGEGMRKKLKISVAHFDNSALIKTYSKTLIGRCMNPEEQEMKALKELLVYMDLGFGKFQFDFKTEEELEGVLKQQPFHFDYWMLALARWQQKQSKAFPSEIMFWVRVIGLPLEFRTVPTFESIVDLVQNRVQVVIDAFKELCFESTIDFKVSLRYEKLFGYCKLCASLCHKEEHDERARSYNGVVINGNVGQQNKEREGREYYGKGKGKMAEAQDSKWVKVAEKGHRRPYNNQGNYRGDGEGSRYKSGRREDARNGNSELGFGEQRGPPREDREEGEIKNNGEEDTRLPSREFQMELAKTHAEGTEVIVEPTNEERGLNMINRMVEKRDYTEEDLEMELEAINATLLENGDDMEEEEEFQTFSEEEAEQASRAQVLREHALEEEKMVSGEADVEKGTGPEVGETKQGNRKRLFKPSISTAGSTKMRLASALVSPRKRAAAKMGPRHGDSSKPPESKGPSNPKLANLKF
ncbi:hypothetical protein Bca52824_052076 [Brassica carinata]|uniref:DUF4283 domain-containing protein n=1 Tax=Brassica carinata TaxID=52824 RepID=A0A8X7R314_BRACI|nr:hypothetical protein Bca52824_052076 [Brassica carinata]